MKAAYYPLLILLVGLILSFVLVREHPIQEEVSPRKINLAMRQIAHELLRQQGDQTTQIPKVKPYGETEFLLLLETHIDYDQLIKIGPRILAQHGITKDYNLALLDCTTADIVLGFDAANLGRGDTLACASRYQTPACHNLSFSTTRPSGNGPRPMLYIMGSLALLSIILSRTEKQPEPEILTKATATPLNATRLSSQTTFSFQTQEIKMANEVAILTFREAKLLDFLSQHPNEVLDRERIHAAVWGSEGIIVGRSLDVFISRLRKKLAADPEVEIVTVHGVGYRLKTASS